MSRRDTRLAQESKNYFAILIKHGKLYYLKHCKEKHKKPNENLLFEINSFILNNHL